MDICAYSNLLRNSITNGKYWLIIIPITIQIITHTVKYLSKWNGGQDLIHYMYDELSKIKNIKNKSLPPMIFTMACAGIGGSIAAFPLFSWAAKAEVKASRKDQSDCFFGPNVLRMCQMADIAFMALHGENGENGKVQAALKCARAYFCQLTARGEGDRGYVDRAAEGVG